jgi:hypothetical protein
VFQRSQCFSSSWGRRAAGGLGLVVMMLLFALAATSRCRAYAWDNHTFFPFPCPLVSPSPCPLVSPSPPPLPSSWDVTAAVLADVTGDGEDEWALLVWRPWQDWPIQRWHDTPSPLADFHDAAGDSCHLILLDPRDGGEIWAGSALPAPLLALAAGDVDGDGVNEVVTLEGSYATGRGGLATHIDVWRWNGFGFTLVWRSPAGSFSRLGLTDVNGDSILDIVAR